MKIHQRTCLIAILILSLPYSANAATDIPAGAVEGTWTAANSPYNINGDIRIDTSKTLIIEPGVAVNFTGRYKFMVFGSLQAVGTASDSIFFTCFDPAQVWEGMMFEATDYNGLDSSRLSFCRFEQGKPENHGSFTGGGGAIQFNYSSDIVIRNSHIRNNYAEQNGGGILCVWSSSPYIVNTTIEDNGCYYNGGGLSCYHGSNPKLVNVVLQNNRAGQFGGGVDAFRSKPELINCLIMGNVAAEAGGGMMLHDSVPVFSTDRRSSMMGNRAPQGAEIHSMVPAHIVLDNFHLADPTPYLAWPDSNFTWDILSPLFTRKDADLYVSPSGDDANDGLTPGTALKTIQHAQRIIGCDEENPRSIFLAAGTYSRPTTGELFPIYAISGMTIEGDGRLTTILDGNREGNILSGYAANQFSLKTLTLQNGLQEGGKGGAVYTEQCGTILLNDLLIRDNEAQEGGGLRINAGDCRLEDVEILDNDASTGGGIFAAGGAITLDNVTIGQDSASAYGGGIYANNSNLTIESAIFDGNYSFYDGGGIYSHYGSIMMSDFTFRNNYADRAGGAIWSRTLGAGSEIQQGTLNNNEAGTFAGAVYLESCGAIKFEKLLLHNNTATSFGSVIYAPNTYTIDFNGITLVDNTGGPSYGAISLPSSNQNISFKNSILRGNSPRHFTNPPSSITYSNIEGASGYGYFDKGCIDTDPMFVNAAGGDYTLQWANYPVANGSKSPCIDTGDPDPAGNDSDGTRADMGYWTYPQSTDFHVRDVSAPATVSSDSIIILSYIIENIGDVPAYPDTAIIWLSDDKLVSEDDSIIRYVPTGIIQAAGDTAITDTLRVSPGLEAGDWYFLVVADAFDRIKETNELNNMDSVMLSILHSPEISLEPFSDTVCLGDSTGFTIEATGTEPLNHQWWKNGMVLADSTKAHLRLLNVTLADTGVYYCVVSNAVGTVNSNSVNLTVHLPATLTSAPTDVEICGSDTISFMMNASGTPPLSYQWFKNGDMLAGATDTIIMIPDAGSADTGWYRSVVSNACGTDADSALLTVHPLPLPELGEDTSICEGDSVIVDPGEFSIYDWMPSWSERFRTIDDSGTFIVMVTDAFGCMNSDTVRIGLNALPSPVLGNDTVVCTGGTVILDPGNFTAYQWTPAHAERLLTATDSGTYSVTVTDLNGCKNSDEVHIGWYGVPEFSLGPDTSIMDNENLFLQADRSFQIYQWSNGDDASGIQVWGSLTPIGANTYWMKGTDAHGCTASDTVIVTVVRDNTFTGANVSPGLEIWPNPAGSHVSIRFPNEANESFSFRMTGLSGRLVWQIEEVKGPEINLNTGRFEEGIYIIEIRGPRQYRSRLMIR